MRTQRTGWLGGVAPRAVWRCLSGPLHFSLALQVDFEEEFDPPAFYEGLRRAKALPADEAELERLDEEVVELERRIDAEMARQRAKRALGGAAEMPAASSTKEESISALLGSGDTEVNLSERYILRDALESVVDSKEELDNCVETLHSAMLVAAAVKPAPDTPSEVPDTGSSGSSAAEQVLQTCGLRKPAGAGTLSVKEEQLGTHSQPPPTCTYTCDCLAEYVDPGETVNGELDLTGIDDEELDRVSAGAPTWC